MKWLWLLLGAGALVVGAEYFMDDDGDGDVNTSVAGTQPAASTGLIQAFANGIATAEGYSSSDTLASENNPGDLQASAGFLGTVGSFGSAVLAIFDNATDGWNALYKDLTNHIANNPDQTLAQFLTAYSGTKPGTPENTGYIDTVMQSLGISDPDTPLSELPNP